MASGVGLARVGPSQRESRVSLAYAASGRTGSSAVYCEGSGAGGAKEMTGSNQLRLESARTRSRTMRQPLLRTIAVLTGLLVAGAVPLLGPGTALAVTPSLGSDCGV